MTTATLRQWAVSAALAATALLSGCGGGATAPAGSSSAGGTPTLLIALDVPASADPYVTSVITRGAQLAVDTTDHAGGVKIGGATYELRIRTYDDGNDPGRAASNVDQAIQDGAIGVIEDGIGTATSGARSSAAGVPEIVITDGSTTALQDRNGGVVASLFGLRIPNDAAADVLATYIYRSCQRVAILHDDSDNGRDGSETITAALNDTDIKPGPTIEVSAAAPTIDTQALQIEQASPCATVLWGGDLFLGRAITALRTAGYKGSIYTNQAGESPAVRQLAGNAATDGVKLVCGRTTSEGDTADFPRFEHALAADHLGPTDAGFKDGEGQEIRQPNDIDFFSYDAVNVLVAAYRKLGSVTPSQQLLTDMTLVSVRSANGDARGFDSQAHEAFAFQDAYIAVIHDMQFEPVKDEALSASLPVEDEILSDFH